MPFLQWLLNFNPWKPPKIAAPPVSVTFAGDRGSLNLVPMIQGSLLPDMTFPCTSGGVPATAALTAPISIQLRWKKPDNTVALVTMVLVDATAGTVKRVWVAGDTDQVGTHYGQVVVTTASGELEQFPEDGGHFIWNIFPQLVAGSHQLL